MVGSIVGILLIIGSILLYRSYALYKEEKTFNVIRGQVPEFSKTDLVLSMTLDGSTITTAPSKGAYTISVTCDKGATGYWDYDAWSVVVGNINEVKVKCTIAFKTGSPKFNEYIMAKSEVTNSGVEKVTHEVTEQTPALTDYRYVGANPNNYVCFGYDVTRCPDDNLYRIIGVIPIQSSDTSSYENRVKLIKATNWEGTTAESGSTFTKSGKGYRWNTTSSNKWESSSLQQTLNNEYYNSLGEYKDYIEQAKWYLGAPNFNNRETYTTEQYYNIERSSTQGSSKGAISFVGNIGLMYPSDYGYSLGNEYSMESMHNNLRKYINSIWLYQLENKYYEWVINPTETNDNNNVNAWSIGPGGDLNRFPTSMLFGIRPTFYLKSSVQYTSGDGSINNPYHIGL